MTEYRHGALHVVENAPDHNQIQRDLKAIDDRLFLERQVALDNIPVWCVVVQIGGDQPPLTILEYRDEFDLPLPLSSGIVHRVARMERDGKRLVAGVMRKNAERIERANRDRQEAIEEMVREFQKISNPIHSPLFPRGQYLRRARDKQRARGENV